MATRSSSRTEYSSTTTSTVTPPYRPARGFVHINKPDLWYSRFHFPFWMAFVTFIFAICFFVVSALAVMAATSSVTVYWPIAIASGVYILLYAFIGAIIFAFYTRTTAPFMANGHNASIYFAFIVTIVLGVLIFAVDINWLDRFSTCCDSDVIELSVITQPQFTLYFIARLWEMFGYFLIGAAQVPALWVNLYPYRVVESSVRDPGLAGTR